MTAKEQAFELLLNLNDGEVYPEIIGEHTVYAKNNLKRLALVCVNQIIAANPHSNPFNTDVYSTMGYWLEVKSEIEKL